MQQQSAQLGVEHATNLLHALENLDSKNHDEFMQQIIKENRMNLGTLGKGFKYQYHVSNHEPLIVTDELNKSASVESPVRHEISRTRHLGDNVCRRFHAPFTNLQAVARSVRRAM